MSYNTGTKGHSMKLKGGKFQTDRGSIFIRCVFRLRSSPPQEIAKTSNMGGFEKDWHLGGQCEC